MNKDYIARTAKAAALKDINNYIKKSWEIKNNKYEAWIITPKYMDTKYNRALNRQLGLHRINKLNNKNGKRNK